MAGEPGASKVFQRQAGRRTRLSRIAVMVAAIALLGGGAAAFLMTRSNAPAGTARSREPGPAGTEAGQRGGANIADSTPHTRDPAVHAEVIDAGSGLDAPGHDTETVHARPRHDPDGRAGPRQPVDIQVVTVPSYARLYIGNDYLGKNGATIRKPEGTTWTVECRLDGYLPGRVKITFGRGQEVRMCTLTRIQRCVEGLKNPFDDCPE
jgi:hypothetical protein